MVEVLLLFYYEIFFCFNVEGIAQKFRSFDIPENRSVLQNSSSLIYYQSNVQRRLGLNMRKIH